MWFPWSDWEKKNRNARVILIHRHKPHDTTMTFFLSPSTLQPSQRSATWLLWPPESILACLMVMESWHREWPGKSLNAVAQFGNASHSLRILNKEVLEVLELSWRRQKRREVERFFLAAFVLSPLFQTAYCTFVVVHRFKLWFKN